MPFRRCAALREHSTGLPVHGPLRRRHLASIRTPATWRNTSRTVRGVLPCQRTRWHRGSGTCRARRSGQSGHSLPDRIAAASRPRLPAGEPLRRRKHSDRCALAGCACRQSAWRPPAGSCAMSLDASGASLPACVHPAVSSVGAQVAWLNCRHCRQARCWQRNSQGVSTTRMRSNWSCEAPPRKACPQQPCWPTYLKASCRIDPLGYPG